MPFSKAITDAVSANNIVYLQACTPQQLYEYYHPNFKNILLYAAYWGNLATLTVICNKLTDNQKRAQNKHYDFEGRTMLMLAVVSKNAEKVSFLLNNIPNIDINNYDEDGVNENKEGWAAIDYCVVNFNQGVFEILINNDANFDEFTWENIFDEQDVLNYFTPEKFLSVVINNQEKLINRFIGYLHKCKKCKINYSRFLVEKSNYKRHALFICAKQRQYAFFKSLLEFPFCLQDEDTHHHTLFYYLLQDGRHDLIKLATDKLHQFTVTTKAEFSAKIDHFNYDGNRDSRKLIGDMLSRAANHSKDGRSRLAFPHEEHRPPRTFNNQRTRQLLRHLATQVYFYLQKQGQSLEEVEAMFLRYKGADYIIIVGNPFLDFSEKRTNMLAPGALKQIITTEFYYEGKYAAEKNARSARYAAKIKKRVFDDAGMPNSTDTHDKARVDSARSILHSGKVNELSWAKVIDDANNGLDCMQNLAYKNSVVLLYTTGEATLRMKSRHAEELFVDFTEKLPKNDGDPDIYSVVAGKMRPCTGCFGRMQGKVSEYGQHPGRYWSHSMKFQDAQAAKHTAKALFEKAAHVSTTSDGKVVSIFDSGSDTDED